MKSPHIRKLNINNSQAAGRYYHTITHISMLRMQVVASESPKTYVWKSESLLALSHEWKADCPCCQQCQVGHSAKAQEKVLVSHGLEMVSPSISRAPGLNNKKWDKLLLLSTPAAFHKDQLMLTWNSHSFPQVPPEDFGVTCKQAHRSWLPEFSCGTDTTVNS